MTICTHPISSANLIVQGECKDCGEAVHTACAIYKNGLTHFWVEGADYKKTENHPSNLWQFVEKFPNVWFET